MVTKWQCNYNRKMFEKSPKSTWKMEKEEGSISVFCWVVFWRNNKTSSFPCSSVYCFNNVYHFLFVLHCPVDLVVVACAQINHDVLVPRIKMSIVNEQTWSNTVQFYQLAFRLSWTNLPVTTHLKKNMTVHGSYNSYILLKSGTSVMSTR